MYSKSSLLILLLVAIASVVASVTPAAFRDVGFVHLASGTADSTWAWSNAPASNICVSPLTADVEFTLRPDRAEDGSPWVVRAGTAFCPDDLPPFYGITVTIPGSNTDVDVYWW